MDITSAPAVVLRARRSGPVSLVSPLHLAIFLLLLSVHAEALGHDHAQCQLSLLDTDGFICQSDMEWSQRARIIREAYNSNSQHKTYPSKQNLLNRLWDQRLHVQRYFMENWHAEFGCELQMRIGSTGDGGKCVCDPPLIKQSVKTGHACLVYSLGSNDDFSFEEAVLALIPSCEVHTFDMTTGREEGKMTNGVHFHPYGLAAEDAPTQSVFSLGTILSKLRHSDSDIDILKIDIEGNEFPFFINMFLSGNGATLRKARQVLIEIHYSGHASQQHWKWTVDEAHHQLFEWMHLEGFVIFQKINYIAVDCIEYAFLRLAKDFFSEKVLSATKHHHESDADAAMGATEGHSHTPQQSQRYLSHLQEAAHFVNPATLHQAHKQPPVWQDLNINNKVFK